MPFHIIAGLLVIVGLIGVVYPIFPGVPIIYSALLIEYFTNHPPPLSPLTLVIFGTLTAISLLGDQLGRFVGAKYGKAGRAGGIGGLIGLLIGVLFAPLGLWSLILLPPLGVIVGELLAGRQKKEAMRAGVWTLLGSVASLLLNLLIASTMLIWFIRVLV